MSNPVEALVRKAVTGAIFAAAGFNRWRQDGKRRHPFLSGIHAPVTEERTLFDLRVTGTIPHALAGRYVRIGPNPFAPDPRGHHWFAGDGMVHGVRLRDGRALWYRNRYVRSRDLERKGGPAAAPGPRRVEADVVNTNVVNHAGKTLALVEAGSFPVHLSDELESIAYSDLEGTLRTAFSAHPHRDARTGELHAVVYDALNPDTVHHVVVDRDGRVTREMPIPVEHGPSIHDCAITDRYVLVFDLPVTFSMKALLSGMLFPFTWNPTHRARVGLLPRDGTAADLVWCEVDPCFVFHIANGFDTYDGKVCVDVAAYETMFADGFDGPNGRALGLERWTLDPSRRTVHRRTLDAKPQEFPRTDERFFGRPHRYVWAMSLPDTARPEFLGATSIHRFDVETGARVEHDFGPDQVPGEFVFVPRSADAVEGEGWLLGYVLDAAKRTTDLVILDAADLAAAPVASVHIPHRIPPGFHGNWLPDEG